MNLTPQFGVFLNPGVDNFETPLQWAKTADETGLDWLTIQDHPYQRRFLETWTLLTALAVSTENIHVSMNVGNLPLRPPAVLAKQVTTLDVLTHGRAALGLGAGAFWEGVAAFGGEKRTPGEAFGAFKDALHIIRDLWESDGKAVTYTGEHYQVKGAHFGPLPTRKIPILVGAYGPKMLDLAGRMTDGVIVSLSYIQPPKLLENNARIDAGAEAAGRTPQEIQRMLNVGGTIRPGNSSEGSISDGALNGTTAYWVEQLVQFSQEYRQDTFIFSPNGDVNQQIEIFAKEIVPRVKDQLTS